MKRILTALLLVLVLSNWAWAESSVWKAQRKNSTIYLGGTFHLLRQADFPLPPEYDRAYRASQVLVFETDLAKIQEPATQQKILAKATYQDGSSIESHLSPQIYGELDEFCAQHGFPLEALGQLKPSMLVTTLTLLELMRLGVSQQGVDLFYYELALRDGKKVEGLETTEQHIDYLLTMGEGEEDAFVSHSLKEMATLEEKFDTLARAWRKGDEKLLGDLLVTELQQGQPQLYRKLLLERNRNWLRQIKGYGAARKTTFILVGAAHLVGPDGLVAGLGKLGYRVSKL